MRRDATKIPTWRSRVLAWFDLGWWFPPTCAGCDSVAAEDRLCPSCDVRIFARPEPPIRCAPCGTRVDALAWFEGEVRDLLLRLKFGRDTHAATAFVNKLTARAQGLRPRFDAIVPMPMSPLRRLVRGFNQAEVLASPLVGATGAPMLPRLLARRHRTAQSGLDRAARLANLAGAFTAPRLDGVRVLLVDDVVTTGATISAAASALRLGGAADVHALVVARAPDQK